MKNQASPAKNTQSGSIFVWLLVMIALFAALSFAMSQGFRSGASSLTSEQAKLAAGEIVEYSTAVRNAIKMMNANGIPPQNICVSNDETYLQNGTQLLPASYYNHNCTDNSCKLFKPTGGGLNIRNFYDDATMDGSWDPGYPKVGSVDFIIAGVDGVGSAESEIIMRVSQVKPEICTAINVMAGVGSDPINEPGDGGAFYNLYGNSVATYLAATNMNVYGTVDTRVKGHKTFCDNTARIVYAVVYAR